ncbi:hypothetical protein NDU88_002434 [Pleurodeles waltl]|uniref:Uncharacterized protein n=1 Tax=Pleurodeles waltl TaxID=8319 RepID=A0AAV7WQN4_PLEWA|nr:hypothetical protein NDU88_002434 [Pleurodeles waltl]
MRSRGCFESPKHAECQGRRPTATHAGKLGTPNMEPATAECLTELRAAGPAKVAGSEGACRTNINANDPGKATDQDGVARGHEDEGSRHLLTGGRSPGERPGDYRPYPNCTGVSLVPQNS